MAEVGLGVDVVDRGGHVEPGHASTLEAGPVAPTEDCTLVHEMAGGLVGGTVASVPFGR
jgi:hypothetical protein